MHNPDYRRMIANTWPIHLKTAKEKSFTSRNRSKNDKTSFESQVGSQNFVKVNQFLNLKQIGKGSYGQVFKCLDTET